MRPYYLIGGYPYLWTISEKNIIFYNAKLENIDSLNQKATERVVDWGSYLCGLINENEE
jgi:hypothetical protein